VSKNTKNIARIISEIHEHFLVFIMAEAPSAQKDMQLVHESWCC